MKEVTKKIKANQMRTRNKQELQALMQTIHDTLGDYDFTTRVLAWSSGTVTNFDIHKDLRMEANKRGLEYTPPEYEL